MTKPLALVVYDYETTDQDPKIAIPVQTAAILVRPEHSNHMVIMNCLSNPNKPIDPEASEVHGIYNKDVKTSPPAVIVVHMLKKYVEALEESYEIIIAGQNHVAYDNTISVHQGWPEIVNYPQIDTLTLARRMFPLMFNHKLDTLYENATGNPLSGAHDAIVDVMAVASILKAWLPEYDNDYRKMAEECATPQAWEIMPISKAHKGKHVRDVPAGFWKYMLTKTTIAQENPDFAETLKVYHNYLWLAHVKDK